MNLKHRLSNFPWKWLRLIAVVAVLIAAGVTWSTWWPAFSNWVDQSIVSTQSAAEGEDVHAEEGGDESLVLSDQARRSLGLTEEFLKPLAMTTYRRTIVVPAVVESRPGRTQVLVSAPLTGVVTHVHAVTLETVSPGTLLFEIRLTHEDLVRTQTEFLTTLGELEVEYREIERLAPGAETGAVPGRTLLERQYARDKLEALMQAQREALRLHGLSEDQVDQIADSRRLLRDLQIVAPGVDVHDHDEELHLSTGETAEVSFDDDVSGDSTEPLLLVEHLDVRKGQAVTAGDPLCQLADYSRLYIEGQAFEQDLSAISHAFEQGWTVTAIFDEESGEHVIEGIELSHLAAEVDRESRTMSFFAELPNEVLRDVVNSEGQRFVSWRFRPGRRLELLVPVEEMPNQFVVPVDAVAQEGADSYVFQMNGSRFDRRPVTVLHRDRRNVVIANDGSLYPGDVIALRSAHQMQMAIKNNSGGAVDPHAGHSH